MTPSARTYTGHMQIFFRGSAAFGARGQHAVDFPGIVTSKNRNEYNEDFASVFDATHYFDRVICVEDAPFPKPNPAPLITYLSLSGISAKEALYVGDTAYDSLCANVANVAFGIALWGNSTTNGNDTQNDIDADYVFHTPSDLLDVL